MLFFVLLASLETHAFLFLHLNHLLSFILLEFNQLFQSIWVVGDFQSSTVAEMLFIVDNSFKDADIVVIQESQSLPEHDILVFYFLNLIFNYFVIGFFYWFLFIFLFCGMSNVDFKFWTPLIFYGKSESFDLFNILKLLSQGRDLALVVCKSWN